MATFETYVEVPVLVEYDWDEDRPEIVSIQLRSDNGRTFRPKIDESKLPQVDLESWLNEKELGQIEQDIVEDAAKEAGL